MAEMTPAAAAAAREALRVAQGNVAAAITALVALGPDAPSSVREALSSLGSAFSSMGYADPAVPYRVPGEGEQNGPAVL